MKISHRDFRPPRRSKYVAQPLKRRPTLRILLLAAIGMAVYLKFDTVVSSHAFQSLRKPGGPFAAFFQKGKPPVETAAAPTGLRWALDSSAVEAECTGPQIDSCLDRWNGLGSDAVGTLRAAIYKAKAQWEADATGGFMARFLRVAKEADLLNPNRSVLELARLDLRGAKATVSLSRDPGKNPSPLCAQDRCLDALHPQPPFARYKPVRSAHPDNAAEARIPEAAFISLDGGAAKPIMPGRVMEMPAPGEAWMKIYHGENIFSYYRGFTQVRPGLKNGSRVGTDDTLGLVAAGGDSLEGLQVRIEKDGLMVDPLAYLGLPPIMDTVAVRHVR